MKAALPVREAMIVRKAEEAETILVLDIAENGIRTAEEIAVSGEEDIVNALSSHAADTFICLSLGPKMVVDLALRDIRIIGGVRGNAMEKVREYIEGTLEEDDFTLDCDSSRCSGDCGKCH